MLEKGVRAGIAAGPVGGEGLVVDASVPEANTSRIRRVAAGEPVDWTDPKCDPRAVREQLPGPDAGLAGRKKHRCAHPGPRQQPAQRRDAGARRFHRRCRA